VEQDAVALAGKLSQEVLSKHAAEVDRDKKFPTEAMQAILNLINDQFGEGE